jgi:hypothetical protein
MICHAKTAWKSNMFKRHWFRRHPRKGSIGYLGYVLALVGGVIMIVLSLAAILSFAVHMPFRSSHSRLFWGRRYHTDPGRNGGCGVKEGQRVNLGGCIDRGRISRWRNRRIAHIDRRPTRTTFPLRIIMDMGRVTQWLLLFRFRV